MQNHAGVFRNGQLLKEGIDKMDAIAKDFSNVKVCEESFIIMCITVYMIR